MIQARRRATDLLRATWWPPPVLGGLSQDALAAAYSATRQFLVAERLIDVVEATCGLVHDLGGTIVAAWLAPPHAMPIDVGLGVIAPRLPTAAPVSVSEMHLKLLLPAVVEDARTTVQRLRRAGETIDVEAGCVEPGRRSLDRALADSGGGAALVLLQPDADSVGEGKAEACADLLQVMRASTRTRDVVARYDRDVVAALLPETNVDVAARRCADVHDQCAAAHRGITFSAGISSTDGPPMDSVLARAELALQEARAAGPGGLEVRW